jgi:menaquinone-specific isochorismate synthase
MARPQWEGPANLYICLLMPVIPYRFDLSQAHQDLDRFLQTCQADAVTQKVTQIVSIAVALDPVDPLAVLQALVKPHQRHFYFENSGQQTAMLAIDSAIQVETAGDQRFQAIKEFIQTAGPIQSTGDVTAPFAGPHWFCNFSFFDQRPIAPIAPDQTGFPSAAAFLPRWQIARSGDRCTLVANLVITPETDLAVILPQLWQKIAALQTLKTVVRWPIAPPRLTHQPVTPPQQFQQAVAAALAAIGERQFHKVVLAQALDVVSPLPFNLVASLHNLRQRYPNCYIFSSSFGQGTAFLGASPERLVSVHHRHLAADALAGSAPRGQTTVEDTRLANHLLANPKEMHEHQVVIDFITRQLTGLGLTPQRSPARLLQLANIQHLQTPIWAKLPPAVHLLDVVAALHPTPAVAGAPRALACEQIRRYEAFDRSLYAAPIGWVDQQGNGEFAVGIRSALLEGCHARLFAGAGIVAGSTPEQELAEVQLKLQALLAALV